MNNIISNFFLICLKQMSQSCHLTVLFMVYKTFNSLCCMLISLAVMPTVARRWGAQRFASYSAVVF